MNSVPNCSHTAVLFVGQKTTFQPNLTHQRQIAPIHTRSSGCVFQGGSGERLHGMQEVTGSIPVFSTKKALYFVGSMVLFFFLKPIFGGLHCFACTVFRLLQAVPIQPPTFDFTPFSKKNVCRPAFQQAAASSPSMYGVRSKLKVMLS